MYMCVYIYIYINIYTHTRSYGKPGLVPAGFSEILSCWDPFLSDPQA